jgi:hypothetical protein
MAPWLQVEEPPVPRLVRDEQTRSPVGSGVAPLPVYGASSGLVLVSNVPLKRWTVCAPHPLPSIVQRRRRRGS